MFYSLPSIKQPLNLFPEVHTIMITEFNSTYIDDQIAHACDYNNIEEARAYCEAWRHKDVCKDLRYHAKKDRHVLEQAGYTNVTRQIDRMCTDKFPVSVKQVDERLNNTHGIAGRGSYQQTIHDVSMNLVANMYRGGYRFENNPNIVPDAFNLIDTAYKAKKDPQFRVG